MPWRGHKSLGSGPQHLPQVIHLGRVKFSNEIQRMLIKIKTAILLMYLLTPR